MLTKTNGNESLLSQRVSETLDDLQERLQELVYSPRLGIRELAAIERILELVGKQTDSDKSVRSIDMEEPDRRVTRYLRRKVRNDKRDEVVSIFERVLSKGN